MKKQLKAMSVGNDAAFDKIMKRTKLNSDFSELLFEDIRLGIIMSFDDIDYTTYLKKLKDAGKEISNPDVLLCDMKRCVDVYKEEYDSIEVMKRKI